MFGAHGESALLLHTDIASQNVIPAAACCPGFWGAAIGIQVLKAKVSASWCECGCCKVPGFFSGSVPQQNHSGNDRFC